MKFTQDVSLKLNYLIFYGLGELGRQETFYIHHQKHIDEATPKSVSRAGTPSKAEVLRKIAQIQTFKSGFR